MLSSNNKLRARRLLALLVIGLSVGVGLAVGGGSSAARVAQVDGSPLTGSAVALSSGGSSSGKGSDASPHRGGFYSYHYLVPQPGGPCNGCTVHVGDRFTLDLMVHSGHFPTGAQQAYLTFSNSLLQNVRVPSPGCVLAQTMQADLSTFDTNLQNEVCNGPTPCFFRGILTDPGSMAFASGALNSCEMGCTGDFRVAAMGLCATAPGQAILHWQFSPPDPPTRNTWIVDAEAPPCACPPRMCVPYCYEDYVINVIK